MTSLQLMNGLDLTKKMIGRMLAPAERPVQP
jgi:hypothetical protein